MSYRLADCQRLKEGVRCWHSFFYALIFWSHTLAKQQYKDIYTGLCVARVVSTQNKLLKKNHIFWIIKTKVKKCPSAKLIASVQRAGGLKLGYFFYITEFSTNSSVTEPIFF